MFRHATIPLARAWNTWSSRPAEMVFLPLGVRLTPVAYANSTGRATLFPAGEAVTLGRHAIDADTVEVALRHAGTVIDWSYRKAGPFDLVGSWATRASGEWGLRFWINLCVSAEGGEMARYDAATRSVTVKVGSRFVVVACDEPVQVTGHAGLEALVEDYEAHGYFHLGARAQAAPVLALRFNLEMNRTGRFAVAIADREDLAIAQTRALLATPLPAPVMPEQTGSYHGALDAVRDVMAWLSIWDEVNARPATCISRNWNLTKFGGFGVWLNDQLYATLMASLFDAELARENLAVALASATPQGNLACLLTANDAWVDRTQLPIGAFIVWLIHLRTGDMALLRAAYDTLARNHAWWWETRDPDGRGLASYGTSDVGEALYRGTSFGARNESGMDNSPIHDEAEYDPVTRTLTTIDVGLNSLLVLDAEMLGLIAAKLGLMSAAASHRLVAETTRAKVRVELWDDARKIFANRLRSGSFVRSLGPTSFYPLICGAADATQLDHLLKHLSDERTFGGTFVLPGTARDDPAARDNVYWRGRIWPPLNYAVWQGLRRYGRRAEASRLAMASLTLFRGAWDEWRLCPENYNAETGEPLDQPDTEGFYNWGALMPMMGVGEVMDMAPWAGWEICNDGGPLWLGPVQSPVGAACVKISGGVLTLTCGENVLLATNLIGRLTHVCWGDRLVSLCLPETVRLSAELAFPVIPCDRVVTVRVGTRTARWAALDNGFAIVDLGPSDGGACVTIVLN